MRPLLVLLTLFITVGATALDLPRANEKWITLRVDEFEIVSNASPSATTDIAEDLLRMRAAVGKVTRLNVRSPLPTKVFIFANERSFAPYREVVFGRDADNISGIFLGGENGNFILLQGGSQNGVDRIVFHELTHYFVKNTVAGLPLWVNEGIAEYYSTFKTFGDEVHIGRPIDDHVLWLRGKALIPLRDLISVDRDSKIYNERSRQGVFYAESWALLHYLMLGSEERRGQLTTYLALIAAHRPADEAFTAAFGVTYAQMEVELRGYVRRNAFQYTRYSLRDLAMSDVQKPEPMTYAAVVFQMGHLLANSPPANAGVAEQFLAEALKANPANAAAHADVGRLHDLAGRRREAEESYQRAAQLGSTDPEIYLLYGSSVISRLGDEVEIPMADVQKARALFTRSAELDPNSARAWAGIGATYAASTESPMDGIAALQKSLALAPGNQEAAFYLVQLYSRSGRRADALQLIDTIITPAGDREMIARSQESLLMADMLEVESLANADKLPEAVALAKTIIARTTNPALAEHVRKMIASLEEFDATGHAIAALNDAVTKANEGRYAEALAIVDNALPAITDPEMLEKAKELRNEVAERAKPRKRQ